MQSPARDLASFIEADLRLAQRKRVMAGGGEDERPFVDARLRGQHSLRRLAEWPGQIDLRLVSGFWQFPVAAADLAPLQLSGFVPASSRQQQEPHQSVKRFRLFGRRPYSAQFFVIERACPFTLLTIIAAHAL